MLEQEERQSKKATYETIAIIWVKDKLVSWSKVLGIEMGRCGGQELIKKIKMR